MIPLGFYLDSVSVGLWCVVIGYYFLLFAYMLFQRYRIVDMLVHRTRLSNYWLYLANFFLLLAFGRGFFIIADFYSTRILWWRVATCFQWFGLAFLALLIGYLLLDKRSHQVLIATPPPIIAILILIVPKAMIGPTAVFRIIINNVLAPIYAIFIPALFFYLAYQSVGTIRRGALLNGIGFLVLYAGRVIVAEVIKQALTNIPWIAAILAPGLVILALILISYGNQYELLT